MDNQKRLLKLPNMLRRLYDDGNWTTPPPPCILKKVEPLKQPAGKIYYINFRYGWDTRT